MNKLKLDKVLLISTFSIILSLFIIITVFNKSFVSIVDSLNYILTNKLGFYYILVGAAFMLILIGLALSKYGKIKIGGPYAEKSYNNFSWAAMIFTSTMAADIIFFSLHEWIYYYADSNSTYLAHQGVSQVASTYPLFHWGIIPWSFYLLPAAAYAYIQYNRSRDCYRLSQACYPLIKSSKILRIIDILGVVGLIVAVSTTFSLATPLLSSALASLLGMPSSIKLVVGLIILMGVIYCVGTLFCLKGISLIARFSYVVFGTLLGLVLISGDTVFIIEHGVASLGNLIQNQLGMSFYFSENSFTQDWTIFYWAYWIAWSIATPFFIAKISKGRSIRSMLLGGLGAGLSGTFTSFIILGNAGLALEQSGHGIVEEFLSGNLTESQVILKIIDLLPNSTAILIVLVLCMIMLYVSTLDSIIYVISRYSYKNLGDLDSSKSMKIYWSLLFLLLPIALVYLESTMSTLKTLSIILAFPISIILILVVINFIKELKKGGGLR